jgi:hypothetical protein
MATAEQERRDTTYMVEVMILDYCGRNSIAIMEEWTVGNNKKLKGK